MFIPDFAATPNPSPLDSYIIVYVSVTCVSSSFTSKTAVFKDSNNLFKGSLERYQSTKVFLIIVPTVIGFLFSILVVSSLTPLDP